MTELKSLLSKSCAVIDKNTGKEVLISSSSEEAIKSAAFNISGKHPEKISDVILTKVPNINSEV